MSRAFLRSWMRVGVHAGGVIGAVMQRKKNID